MMDSELQTLTSDEFASLLSVGDMCAASIPFEHELRLTRLGYVADLDGRLRVTTSGSARIAAAGFEDKRRLDSNQAAEDRNRPARGDVLLSGVIQTSDSKDSHVGF